MLSESKELVIEGPSEGCHSSPAFPSTHKELFQQCKMTLCHCPGKQICIAKTTWAWHCEIAPGAPRTIKEAQLNRAGWASPKLHAANSSRSQSWGAGNVWESHLVKKALRNSVEVFSHSLPDKVVICCLIIGRWLLAIIICISNS